MKYVRDVLGTPEPVEPPGGILGCFVRDAFDNVIDAGVTTIAISVLRRTGSDGQGAPQTYQKDLAKELGRAGVSLGTELLCHYVCFNIWLVPDSGQKQIALRILFKVLGTIAEGMAFPRGEVLSKSDVLCAVGSVTLAQWRNGATFPGLKAYLAWRHWRP
jgi:hypothetical protein